MNEEEVFLLRRKYKFELFLENDPAEFVHIHLDFQFKNDCYEVKTRRFSSLYIFSENFLLKDCINSLISKYSSVPSVVPDLSTNHLHQRDCLGIVPGGPLTSKFGYIFRLMFYFYRCFLVGNESGGQGNHQHPPSSQSSASSFSVNDCDLDKTLNLYLLNLLLKSEDKQKQSQVSLCDS